jgi:hypothetical protein
MFAQSAIPVRTVPLFVVAALKPLLLPLQQLLQQLLPQLHLC